MENSGDSVVRRESCDGKSSGAIAGMPKRLGSWDLIREIGSGGWGAVFLCRHLRHGGYAAVKVLWPKIAADSAQKKLFLEKVRCMAELGSHPRFLKVWDVDEDQGFLFLVTEMMQCSECHGEPINNLAQWQACRLRAGDKITESQVVMIGSQILEGLEHAHGKGLMHHNLKPTNVLINGNGHAVLADLGLVRIDDIFPDPMVKHSTSLAERRAFFAESEDYISPEQDPYGPWEMHEANHLADLWIVGAVLFKLLKGRKPQPFRSHSPREMGVELVFEGWDGFLNRSLQEDPSRRWISATDMKNALEKLKAGRLVS